MGALKIRLEELAGSRDSTVVLLLIGAFLACTAVFFGILQLDIDIGRDFVIADLMGRGAVLYRDVMYLYGPFAPWLHWLLFRLFGVSILALQLAGATTGLLIVLLTYLVARQILPPAPAAVAGLLVIVHSVYDQDLFGYATPYTFAAPYGLLFSLLTLYAALRVLDAPAVSRWDFVAGGAAALALASKQEFAIISAVTLAGALALRFYRAPKRLLPAAAASAACYALIAGTFAFLLFRRVSLADFLRSVYPKESFQAWRHFYDVVGGWGPYFWGRVRDGTAGFLYNLGFVIWATCFVVVLGSVARRERRPGKLLWGLLTAALLFLWRFPYPWYYPVLLHGIVLVAVITGRARCSAPKAGLLTVSAVVFLFRILPFPVAGAYGQMYFIPSLIVYLYLCYEIVAPRLSRFFPEQRLQRIMTGVLVVCFVIPEFVAQDLLWARPTEAIRCERGVVRVNTKEAAKARLVLEEIRSYSLPQDKILLLPCGAMYYFLSNRQPPSKYLDYTNGQLVDGAPEQEEIRHLSQAPPKLVVIDDFPEEGQFAGPVNTFGRAYDVQLARWIHENYREVRSIAYQGRLVHFLIPNQDLLAASRAPAGRRLPGDAPARREGG